jgi:acetyl-CoA C-acetyltransferase
MENKMVDLIGFAHTPFARGLGLDVEGLMTRVALEALADAQLDAADLDAVVVGHFNHGMSAQGFTAGLVGGLLPALHGKPAVRVENACASGSAAVHHAASLVKSGEAKRVLVIGVELMSALPTREIGKALLGASYAKEEANMPAGFAGMFAHIAEVYAARFGDPHPAMARIAAKNHANGAHNPWAQLREPLDEAFCATESERNPRVVGRLLRSDCSPVSDGAAALIVASPDARPAGAAVVRLRATAQATDRMPMSQRDMSELAGARMAWQRLLQRAGIGLNDLDLVETHDCFTIAELMQYEAMGLTEPGQGARALDEGWVMPGGRLPVNLSGGLKAKGHPIGATGVSMHVLAAWQLLGRWRSAELPRSRLAAVFNMGGAGVANYGSVLERLA